MESLKEFKKLGIENNNLRCDLDTIVSKLDWPSLVQQLRRCVIQPISDSVALAVKDTKHYISR
jgi:hypothetical protein